MHSKNIFLRRLSYWVLFSTLMICLLSGIFFYFGIETIETEFARLNNSHNITIQGQTALQKITFELERLNHFGLPVFIFVLVFLGFIFRWIIGRSFKKHVQRPDGKKSLDSEAIKNPKKISEKIIYKVDKNREKLLYSHLLATFQRKGQWVDFLNENLDQYEDAQIGAAVRNIQENCKDVLNTHIQLKPILNQEQGENIRLEEGFSPDTIKLVGNVHGAPPFNGIIRHRGWKIQKVDIPDFSGEQNLEILAPAEVEIK